MLMYIAFSMCQTEVWHCPQLETSPGSLGQTARYLQTLVFTASTVFSVWCIWNTITVSWRATTTTVFAVDVECLKL